MFRIYRRVSRKEIAFTIKYGSVLELELSLRITGSPTGMTCDVVTVAISRHVCLFFDNSIFLLVGLPNTNVTVKTVKRYHQRHPWSAPTTGTSAVLRGGYSDNFVNMMVDIGASRNVIEDATSPGCGTDQIITRCWMHRENCPRPGDGVAWHCAGIAPGRSGQQKRTTDLGPNCVSVRAYHRA